MGEPLAHGIGDLYTISFFLTEDGSDTTYSDVGTDGDTTNSGGNGIDVLSCASASFNINQVPEPVSVLVLTAGLLGLGAARRVSFGRAPACARIPRGGGSSPEPGLPANMPTIS